MCSGYYSYDGGHDPDFPGRDDFTGEIVHPQFWPDDLDVTGRRIVIVGSGSTAVTLLPSLAPDAGHVTMLQRSPSYIVSVPGEDTLANLLRRLLPQRLAYWLVRWKNITITSLSYWASRRWPNATRKWIIGEAAKELPAGYLTRFRHNG